MGRARLHRVVGVAVVAVARAQVQRLLRGAAAAMRRAQVQRLLLVALLHAASSQAQELPAGLQARLLSKLPTYVKTLAGPAGAPMKVLVVHAGSAEALTRGAQALVSGIDGLVRSGAFSAQVVAVPFTDAKRFAAVLEREQPRVLYLAPELSEQAVREVVQSVSTLPVLTLSGMEAHVRLGVVLGLVEREGSPRLLVNLKQAARQGIAFHNGLLRNAIPIDP